MKSVYRWIFNHDKLAKTVLIILVTVLCYILLDPMIYSFGIRFFITFSLLFSCLTFVNSMPDKLLREPLELLENQCDPYPFLTEIELQFGRAKDNFRGQMTAINYAMALTQTGDVEKALQVLTDIEIERFSITSPYVKFIYYNNLCDAMTRLERFSEADYWYRKASEIYQQLPEGRMKKQFDRTVRMNEIEHLYRDADYSSALSRLARIPCPTQRSLMEAALLAARCNLKLEEYDKAREKLQYVADHGNRLACAQEAKTLLNTLP